MCDSLGRRSPDRQQRYSSRTPAAGRRRLAGLLCIALLGTASLSAQEPPEPSHAPRVSLLSNDEAWSRLPECPDRGQPLPNWARALALTLPYTTAAMLELDGQYRTTPELDPKLRAKLRWIAARANRCDYAEAYAVADFQRAGGNPVELKPLAAGLDSLPEAERAALEFARQMTLNGSAVTDEEVSRLVELYGEKAVVAMVLELAYANFQDRLLLALDIPLEENGPLLPGAYRFPALEKPIEIPRAARPEELPLTDEGTAPDESPLPATGEDAEWSSLDLAQLRQLLDVQRDRPGRVSVPAWETVRERLPPEIYPPDRRLKIKWSLVVLGHQPRMGLAWMRCLRTFGREAHLDRVLAESVFWVITRTIHCFY